jgi:hypothetical protein
MYDETMNPYAGAPSINRTPFILAGIGALAASAYWGLLTVLLFVGVASGGVSPAQIILPCVLVGLYAVRGFQLFQGDPRAASRILWLHIVGGALAIIYVITGSGFWVALQGLKVAIHVFGGVTAYLAKRSVLQ